MGRRTRSRLLLTGTAGAVLTLGGCGSTPTPSPPTGVDGLSIPTPDPQPGDFVAEVDNPLFPLDEGGSWTYEADDGSRVVVAVLGQDEVDGVPVTTISRTSADADGEETGERVSSYAQDTDGNVWSFGRQVISGPGESWRAGEDGAEAGLLVPAAPRVGDAWLQQESPSLTTRVEVLETDAEVDLADPAALGVEDPTGALVTEDTPRTPSEEPALTRTYLPGAGVVLVADAGSGAVLLELVERSD